MQFCVCVFAVLTADAQFDLRLETREKHATFQENLSLCLCV